MFDQFSTWRQILQLSQRSMDLSRNIAITFIRKTLIAFVGNITNLLESFLNIRCLEERGYILVNRGDQDGSLEYSQ